MNTISNSKISNNIVDCFGSVALTVQYNNASVLAKQLDISGNVFARSAGGTSDTGIKLYGVNYSVVCNNVFDDKFSTDCISLNQNSYSIGSSHNIVTGNISSSATTGGITESGSSDYNIFVSNSAGTVTVVGANSKNRDALTAGDVATDTSNFNKNLSGGDTTVQAALETLDGLESGGASNFLDLSDVPSSYSGQSGKFVRVNSSESGLEYSVPAGAGDVVAPSTHAASYFPKWNETANSKTLVEGVPAGNNNGNLVVRAGDNAIAVDSILEITETQGVTIDGLKIKDGGVALGNDSDGDIYYRGNGALARLAKGSAGQVLKMNSSGSAPQWEDESSGGTGGMECNKLTAKILYGGI